MRLLLDANLSPVTASLLNDSGVAANHVRDHGLQRADDEEILDFAYDRGLIIVSEDTDFGELLARRGDTLPSYVLIRSADPRSPEEIAQVLLANLPPLVDQLSEGAVVVIESARVRVRTLPIRPPVPPG